MDEENFDWSLGVALFFISGVIFASFFELEKWELFLIAFLVPFFVFLIAEKIIFKKFLISFFFLFGLCFFLGAGFFYFNLEKTKNLDVFSEEKLAIFVISESSPKERYQSFLAKSLKNGNKFSVNISNSFYIQEYDCLEINGKIKNIDSISDDGYRHHLLSRGVKGTIYLPETKKINCPQNLKMSFYKKILSFKNKTKQIINFSLPKIKADFLSALILGGKNTIPKEWNDKLNRTGVSHIIAISGMHITIWAFLIIEFLILLGFWRGQAFYVVILFLAVYLILIGFPASAIRAAIMEVIFLTAQKIGYATQSDRLVIMATFLMILFNPFVIYDIGFQLSVMAILGIIYLSQFFNEIFEKIKIPRIISEVLAMTFAAQIFVIPILAYNFGQISIVSPITNILIAPLFPFILMAGSALIILGFFHLELTFFVNWFLILVFGYFLEVVRYFDKFPFAIAEIKNLSFVVFIIYYLFLSLITWFIIKKRRFQI